MVRGICTCWAKKSFKACYSKWFSDASFALSCALIAPERTCKLQNDFSDLRDQHAYRPSAFLETFVGFSEAAKLKILSSRLCRSESIFQTFWHNLKMKTSKKIKICLTYWAEDAQMRNILQIELFQWRNHNRGSSPGCSIHSSMSFIGQASRGCYNFQSYKIKLSQQWTTNDAFPSLFDRTALHRPPDPCHCDAV